MDGDLEQCPPPEPLPEPDSDQEQEQQQRRRGALDQQEPTWGRGANKLAELNAAEKEEPALSLDHNVDTGVVSIDEEVSVLQARIESGKTYYQILWTDQGGNEHDVWRRYSEFESLRKDMSSKIGGRPEIQTLRFPGKTKLKSKGNNKDIVEDRQGHLQAWLQQLVMAKMIVPDSEGDNAQKLLYEFLSGDSEPEFHRMMRQQVPDPTTTEVSTHHTRTTHTVEESVPPDPSAVEAAISALDQARDEEVHSVLATLVDLTQGCRQNCEATAAIQGKQIVVRALTSSADVVVHCSGMRVLRGLADVPDPIQEDPEPTGDEAHAHHCEAQVNGGKVWESLAFVEKRGSMFVFRRCNDGRGEFTKLFTMLLSRCTLQPTKKKRKGYETAFRVDMQAPAGRKKKEGIKLVIYPKDDAAARIAYWCLHGATGLGIPVGENQSKLMFDETLAIATVEQMAVLAAQPAPPKPDPPHTIEIRCAIASMHLFSDLATSQAACIQKVGWSILQKLASDVHLPTVLAEGLTSLLRSFVMGSCCDESVVGQVCETLQTLIAAKSKKVEYDPLISDTVVAVVGSIVDSIVNGFHNVAAATKLKDCADKCLGELAAVLAVTIHPPEPEPERPQRANLKALRDQYATMTASLQIALRSPTVIEQPQGESTVATAVSELTRLEKEALDKQQEAERFQHNEKTHDEAAKITLQTAVQVVLCKENGQPTSNKRWIWVNSDGSLEWSKRPDKKGKGPFKMTSVAQSERLITITTSGDTLRFTAGDSPPDICDAWHRGCNALLQTPRWHDSFGLLQSQHVQLESLRVEAKRFVDRLVAELQNSMGKLDTLIAQAEDMKVAEDAAIAVKLQSRCAELEAARVHAVSVFPTVDDQPTVIVDALGRLEEHLIAVRATDTVAPVKSALGLYQALSEVMQTLPSWAASLGEIPKELERNVRLLGILTPHVFTAELNRADPCGWYRVQNVAQDTGKRRGKHATAPVRTLQLHNTADLDSAQNAALAPGTVLLATEAATPPGCLTSLRCDYTSCTGSTDECCQTMVKADSQSDDSCCHICSQQLRRGFRWRCHACKVDVCFDCRAENSGTAGWFALVSDSVKRQSGMLGAKVIATILPLTLLPSAKSHFQDICLGILASFAATPQSWPPSAIEESLMLMIECSQKTQWQRVVKAAESFDNCSAMASFVPSLLTLTWGNKDQKNGGKPRSWATTYVQFCLHNSAPHMIDATGSDARCMLCAAKARRSNCGSCGAIVCKHCLVKRLRVQGIGKHLPLSDDGSWGIWKRQLAAGTVGHSCGVCPVCYIRRKEQIRLAFEPRIPWLHEVDSTEHGLASLCLDGVEVTADPICLTLLSTNLKELPLLTQALLANGLRHVEQLLTDCVSADVRGCLVSIEHSLSEIPMFATYMCSPLRKTTAHAVLAGLDARQFADFARELLEKPQNVRALVEDGKRFGVSLDKVEASCVFPGMYVMISRTSATGSAAYGRLSAYEDQGIKGKIPATSEEFKRGYRAIDEAYRPLPKPTTSPSQYRVLDRVGSSVPAAFDANGHLKTISSVRKLAVLSSVPIDFVEFGGGSDYEIVDASEVETCDPQLAIAALTPRNHPGRPLITRHERVGMRLDGSDGFQPGMRVVLGSMNLQAYADFSVVAGAGTFGIKDDSLDTQFHMYTHDSLHKHKYEPGYRNSNSLCPIRLDGEPHTCRHPECTTQVLWYKSCTEHREKIWWDPHLLGVGEVVAGRRGSHRKECPQLEGFVGEVLVRGLGAPETPGETHPPERWFCASDLLVAPVDWEQLQEVLQPAVELYQATLFKNVCTDYEFEQSQRALRALSESMVMPKRPAEISLPDDPRACVQRGVCPQGHRLYPAKEDGKASAFGLSPSCGLCGKAMNWEDKKLMAEGGVCASQRLNMYHCVLCPECFSLVPASYDPPECEWDKVHRSYLNTNVGQELVVILDRSTKKGSTTIMDANTRKVVLACEGTCFCVTLSKLNRRTKKGKTSFVSGQAKRRQDGGHGTDGIDRSDAQWSGCTATNIHGAKGLTWSLLSEPKHGQGLVVADGTAAFGIDKSAHASTFFREVGQAGMEMEIAKMLGVESLEWTDLLRVPGPLADVIDTLSSLPTSWDAVEKMAAAKAGALVGAALGSLAGPGGVVSVAHCFVMSL